MVSKNLVEYASRLASDINASAVMIYADVANTIDGVQEILAQYPLRFIIALRNGESISLDKIPNVVRVDVPNVPMTRLGQVKVALLVSLARGILKKGDRVIFMTGIERSQAIDTLIVLNLETESELISIAGPLVFAQGIQPEVFERVLTIAAEMTFEGREGRPVGTIFVIGDSIEVLKRTENLVLNPFFGYPPSQRNIMDFRMQETIKEFSAIDGAFVIGGDGLVETAGARLFAAETPERLPLGLGTRHAAAAAITNVTNSVAVCVSQSTGNITIFKSGHLIAEVPRPTPEHRLR